MRVITGKFKSRKLVYPRVKAVRPTMDRVKESIFNVLGRDIEDAIVLDLFAGCGSLGIEALSRGARSVTFVDTHPAAIDSLTQNITNLDLSSQTSVLRKDVISAIASFALKKQEFDLILMDPPYGTDITKKTLMKIYGSDILARNGNLVIEHSAHDELPFSKGVEIITHKEFGETQVTFLTKL